jgi:hypothetical protein
LRRAPARRGGRNWRRPQSAQPSQELVDGHERERRPRPRTDDAVIGHAGDELEHARGAARTAVETRVAQEIFDAGVGMPADNRVGVLTDELDRAVLGLLVPAVTDERRQFGGLGRVISVFDSGDLIGAAAGLRWGLIHDQAALFVAARFLRDDGLCPAPALVCSAHEGSKSERPPASNGLVCAERLHTFGVNVRSTGPPLPLEDPRDSRQKTC